MRPNKGMNRSAQQRRCARCWVSSSLRSSAPGYARRSAPNAEAQVNVYSLQRSEAMTKCFVVSVVLLGVLLGWCTTGHSQPLATPSPAPQSLAFALIGDLGYRPEHEPWLENVLTELNQTPLAFVVHVGDLGAPPFGSCTNEFWARRLAQFQASAHPVVFTPGDNEWTDCHEKERAPGYEPLERLARLRTVFFTGEQSLGQRAIPLTRQSKQLTRCSRSTARTSTGPTAALPLSLCTSWGVTTV
jgi:hypothetical protein